MNKTFIIWSLLVISSVSAVSTAKLDQRVKEHHRFKREGFIDLEEVPELVFGIANSVRRGLNSVVHQGKNLRQRMFGFGSSFMRSANRHPFGTWKPIVSPKPSSFYNGGGGGGGGGGAESYGAPQAPIFQQQPAPTAALAGTASYNNNGATGNGPHGINFDDCDCHFGNSDSFKPLPSGFDSSIDSYGPPSAQPILGSSHSVQTSALTLPPASTYTVSSSSLPVSQPSLPSSGTYSKPFVPVKTFSSQPVLTNSLGSYSQSTYSKPVAQSSSPLTNNNNNVYTSSNSGTNTVFNNNFSGSISSGPIITTSFNGPVSQSSGPFSTNSYSGSVSQSSGPVVTNTYISPQSTDSVASNTYTSPQSTGSVTTNTYTGPQSTGSVTTNTYTNPQSTGAIITNTQTGTQSIGAISTITYTDPIPQSTGSGGIYAGTQTSGSLSTNPLSSNSQSTSGTFSGSVLSGTTFSGSNTLSSGSTFSSPTSTFSSNTGSFNGPTFNSENKNILPSSSSNIFSPSAPIISEQTITSTSSPVTSDPIYTPSSTSVDPSPAPQSVNEIGTHHPDKPSDLSKLKMSFINLDEAVIKRVLANTLYYKDLKSFKKYHTNRKIHKKNLNRRRRR